jgi:3-methylornithine--L-lysine ligase
LKVAIVGGKLQGVEASFLAQSLGWKVLLIDRDPNAPARGLCHTFCCCDVINDPSGFSRIAKSVDLVIPAIENIAALRSLRKCSEASGVPFAFDEESYLLTRSKKRSNRFFGKVGVPVPQPWPRCELPVIVKPSMASGSKGVTKLSTERDLALFRDRVGSSFSQWVIQEYLEGPSYSLEVLGFDGHYEVLQVTELEMDGQYDCKRVLAPARIPEFLERDFREITFALASGLGLKGIMDVEVIHHKGLLKVLEIDARLPSQTPTAVLKSSGINMLELLGNIFCQSFLPEVQDPKSQRGVIYEQIQVSEKGMEVLGEHIMGEAGPLRRMDEFFGADSAITNFVGPKFPWVATLIVTGKDLKAAWAKRCRVLDNIEREQRRVWRTGAIGNDTTKRRTGQGHRQRIRSL